MSVSLSKEEVRAKVDLRKTVLTSVLEKKPLLYPVNRVGVVIDKSGSMRKAFKEGYVQEVIERLFPIALEFDDNGELDVWLFNDEYIRMPSVNRDNLYNYVQDNIMTGMAAKFWGQTKYAPVMEDVYTKYVREEPSDIPSYVIFITDGNNSDKANTKNIITRASEQNIFWQFIGIGDEKFEFLQRLDGLKGRTVDNANFFAANDISLTEDRELYDLLLSEYPDWQIEAKRLGILK